MLLKVSTLIAKTAHGAVGQVRRGSGTNYFDHPLGVKNTLADYKFDTVYQSAGILHDVLEDTKITAAELLDFFVRFNPDDENYLAAAHDVVRAVNTLTDKYDGKTNPKYLNVIRMTRKNMETIRILKSNNTMAIAVKLADIFDNCESIHNLDETFIPRWLTEKELFLQRVIWDKPNHRLMAKLMDRFNELNSVYNYRNLRLYETYAENFCQCMETFEEFDRE